MNLIGMLAVLSVGAGHYAKVNGLDLYYEVHGSGAPLVLLHGGGSTFETSFAKAIPLLAKTHQVIAFDQQGHGRTADVDRPFSFEQSADDAVALLKHLKIERADFFGYSNGGTIALQVALRHPEAVRKLVLASTLFARSGADPQFWEGFPRATLETMPRELRDAYVAVAPHPEHLKSFFEKSVKRMMTFQDLPREALRDVRAPALILNGDADVVRPDHAVELSRLLPHARLAIFPATDHLQMCDRFAQQSAVIDDFLR